MLTKTKKQILAEARSRGEYRDVPGRPSKFGEPTVLVQFRLPASIAVKLGVDKNAAAREIITQHFIG